MTGRPESSYRGAFYFTVTVDETLLLTYALLFDKVKL